MRERADETILIVEDDAGIANLERRQLERAGYAVITASTAEEALPKLRQDGIDLLLLDYRLPASIDGLDFHAQMKAAGYDLPVILVTGFGDEATILRALRAGVRDYVTKSVEYLDYLPVAVARVLKEVRTERHIKRAEEQIRQQAALLDKTSDAIVVQDMQDRVLFWNRGAERLYGWTAAEAIGREIGELLYKGASTEREEALKTLIERDEWTGELHQFTRAGKEILVEARCTLTRDEAGQPQSKLAINTDITEKKKAETQMLRNQRLESIGTLAGGIAHDMNNALTPILMSIQILKMKNPDPDSQAVLETLETSAERGAEMVKQILSFAHGVEGERILIQPRTLIKEIQSMLKHTLSKSIELSVTVPRDLWLVMGDATQIHQVLLNLCVNARDAMPNGGKLTIAASNMVPDENYARMHVEAKAGPYVLLTVADTGTGIPPGIIDKIFDPFFTTKEQGKGTGLGLSTAIGIVKSHGGFINVYSEIGKGSEFRVYLPATETGETKEAASHPPEVPAGHGELILVVDDELAICAITKQTLETFGYRVVTANDGAEAIATYSMHRGDIQAVLTDMAMPIMDGYATIRALRKIDPEARIIAASGLTSGGQSAELSGNGVRAFLRKPYVAEKLLTTLHEVLSKK